MSQPEELAIQGHFRLHFLVRTCTLTAGYSKSCQNVKLLRECERECVRNWRYAQNLGEKKPPDFSGGSRPGFPGGGLLVRLDFGPTLHFLKVSRRGLVHILVDATVLKRFKLCLESFYGLDKL